MITSEQVEAVLRRVRPFMQADGGDVEVVAVDGPIVNLRFSGRCAACPSAHMTLYLGIETALRREVPELAAVRLV
jgi:Fe-S cluster biogenesis protein NfuA